MGMLRIHAPPFRMALLACLMAGTRAWSDPPGSNVGADDEIQSLIDKGAFAAAEARLERRITRPTDPVRTPAAIQREILRRIRLDFPWTEEQILQQVREEIADASLQDIRQWRDAGDLQSRTIDGEFRYYHRAVSNLFRWNEVARARRKPSTVDTAGNAAELDRVLEQIVRLAADGSQPTAYPVRHRIKYEVSLRPGHPRVKRGSWLRAWLPYPQTYRQQRDVRLIRTSPQATMIAASGAPHRTVYFEQWIEDEAAVPRFVVEFEYTASAFCPRLDPADVRPYDTDSPLFREYTAARPPHILVTPEVRRLAGEITGQATNPLEKVGRIFEWVSGHIPWCAEMEYSTIPSLSQKGLAARRGDCGVQGMVFITLCRAAGVPARWQSGWVTLPTGWNMHDWSEFYVEPWGWLPADASYGVRDHADPRVRDFFCGGIDPYRLIVNLDYARPLQPEKTSFRSEPNDFQRGEVEINGHNLYFDEWDWTFEVQTDVLK